MARFTVAADTTNAPTATLPGLTLYAVAGSQLELVRCEVYNTTVNACSVSLARFSTAGTQGSGLTEQAYNVNQTIIGTGFQSSTSTPPTLVGDANGLASAYLGAAIGAGVIWGFEDEPIVIEDGTANGVGILCPVGTGRIVRVVFTWDA